MVPVVSFVGKSNSGKTTFLETVVRALKSKGYRVACIKHTHHDFDIDHPGKDTWRLAQAGSEVVAIAGPDKVAIISHPETEPTLSQLAALFCGQVDIVLAEGYKNESTAKILVVNTEPDREQLYNQENILAVVFACSSPSGRVNFADEDVAHIIELLIQQMSSAGFSHHGIMNKSLVSLR